MSIIDDSPIDCSDIFYREEPRKTIVKDAPKYYGFMSPKGQSYPCDNQDFDLFAEKLVRDNYEDFSNAVADSFYSCRCPRGLTGAEFFLMFILGFAKITKSDYNEEEMWFFSYYDMTPEQGKLLRQISQPDYSLIDLNVFVDDEAEELINLLPITWEEAYQRILDSPFGYWPKINIPFYRDEMTAERGLAGSCYDDVYNKLEKAGFVKVRTHLKKNDNYVLVDFWIRSYEESYDGDGYGGGTTDEYAVGIIDDQGRWAYPLTRCIDSHLTSFDKLCSADYLPEDKRPYVWTGSEPFNIID